MIINSIKLQNFQPYYKEHFVEFGEGVNLILGPAGKGKSTLFNAFYWTLFGKLHFTDDGWCERTTRGWMPVNDPTAVRVAPCIDIINARALYEQKDLESVEMTVEIVLTADKTQFSDNKKYTIIRGITARRQDVGDWNDDTNWKLSDDRLSVSFETNNGTIFKDGVEAEEVIRALFDPNIRNYIWFQGESLNKLIDFKDPSTLAAAVNYISYYPAYENMLNTVAKAVRKISNDEQRKIAATHRQNREISNLLYNLKNEQDRLDAATRNRDAKINSKEDIEQKLVENESKLRTLASYTGLVAEYNRCDRDRKDAISAVCNIDNRQRALIPKWCLRGIDSLIAEAREIISRYTEAQFIAPVAKYVDEPGKAKLEEIIKNKKCFVCGTEFEDGSYQCNYILDRLKSQEEFFKAVEEYKENLQSASLFTMLVGKIQDYPERVERIIHNIDNSSSQLLEQMDELLAHKNRCVEKMRAVDEQIEKIRNQYDIDPVRQAHTANIVESNLQVNRTSIKRLEGEINNFNRAIEKHTAEIKRLKSELEKAQGGNNNIEETKWRMYSEALLPICKKVQETARYELLNKIRTTSNELYERFTKHDVGYKGIIEINDDYTFRREPGLNTGHNARKKMSILNAMLMLNQQAQGVYYPFIADAPTSDLDTVSTHMYLLGIQDVFKQSIIMTKEIRVGTKECTELLKQDNINIVYEIEHIDGGDKPEKYEVYSTLKRIK